MIKICNDRSVFPNSVKISNQYENDTRSIDFDLEDIQFTGNTYLICKYQNEDDYYAPLLLDSNNSIPVKTFLSQKDGMYECLIIISKVEIDENYDFSNDNPQFVSNLFNIYIGKNYLSGTSKQWELSPEMKNYYDRLIALVSKVQEDLDNGSFVGNGIKSITLISTVGLVDTYQILFTNGSTFDFQVTNGATPTITIQEGVWFVNGVSTGVSALGQKGEKGDPGVGIVSIEKTSTSGNIDTYTITFTNQTTSTFTVTNGTNGKDGVTPNIQIGTVTTLPSGAQATATITGTPENPILNLGIPEGEQGSGGTTDYNDLENKPQINGVELSGNKSGNDVGLVNSQQGIENSGKVLGIDQDGLVVPVENAGASDNIIYKDVPKQLNPNITDSFQRAMWNLKLYGQSTQGADPSFNNEQPITAISQFDGAPTGGNLFDFSKIKETDGLTIDYENKTITIMANTNNAGYVNNLKDLMGGYKIGEKYVMSAKTSNPEAQRIIYFLDIKNSIRFDEPFTLTEEMLNSPFVWYNNIESKNQNVISNIQIELGETATPYTPYQSQPFTYTPSQNMYSTQDGSISDYVDVEKGAEVYNMSGAVIYDGSEDEKWYPYVSGSYNGFVITNVTPSLKKGNRLNGLCSIYNVTGGGISNGVWFSVNDSNIYFPYINRDLGISTVEEWRTWLSQNPVTVVYQLATPTETPIPQEQLQMLRALYTYNGVTNFLCNAPVSFSYEISQQINKQNVENRLKALEAKLLLQGGN